MGARAKKTLSIRTYTFSIFCVVVVVVTNCNICALISLWYRTAVFSLLFLLCVLKKKLIDGHLKKAPVCAELALLLVDEMWYHAVVDGTRV